MHAEARSVNNRHLKAVIRLPEQLQDREPAVEEIVRRSVSRGTVYATISLDNAEERAAYEIDPSAVRRYYQQLSGLKEELGAGGQIAPEALLNLPGCLRRAAESTSAVEQIWLAAERAVGQALRSMVVMRADEGEKLWRDLLAHKAAVEVLVDDVQQRLPKVLTSYRGRLASRVRRLLEGVDVQVSEHELHRELAIFAERSDVSEELSRLTSHLEQFEKVPLADKDEPCGRKIEFLLQEMVREANTMASKLGDADLVHRAVEIKLEIDKMREQAFNVE